MKKVNVGIVIAGLFISGVMIFLMIQGVSLKERKMVKWSAVESSAVAGQKMARFMFPLSQKFKNVRIVGQGDFVEDFFSGFSMQANKDWAEPSAEQISQVDDLDENDFDLVVTPFQTTAINEACRGSDRLPCIVAKASKAWSKKTRNPSKLWISMYRYDKNKAVLIFKKPES